MVPIVEAVVAELFKVQHFKLILKNKILISKC